MGKLTGKELASYFEAHGKDFNGDGDKFCLAAGYGVDRGDGIEKCNFTDFIQALANAIEDQNDQLIL